MHEAGKNNIHPCEMFLQERTLWTIPDDSQTHMGRSGQHFPNFFNFFFSCQTADEQQYRRFRVALCQAIPHALIVMMGSETLNIYTPLPNPDVTETFGC